MSHPRLVGFCLFALCSARAALARADDACTKPFTELVAELECDKYAADRKRRAELSSTDELEAKNKQAIADLDAEIKRLEDDSPLLKKGACAVRTRTCDTLATTVTMGGDPAALTASLTKLSNATKAEASSADKEVAIRAQEPERQTATNKGGSVAQTDPVESIQPITLAGGALSLSGTHAGTKGVGNITINPLALAAPGDAIAGRMMDLTISAPFDLEGGTKDSQYVSARLRVNLFAPISASELSREVNAWLQAEGRYADRIEEVLAHAKDVKACAKYVAKTTRVSEEECGQSVDDAQLRAAREKAYEKIASLRRAADKYYLGIDARFDSGDPTGPDVVGDKGTHLLGGLAGGVKIFSSSERWDYELRGRAAGDYFRSRDDSTGTRPKPVYSFDWGAAFILSGKLEDKSKQRLAFGAGVEGRQAGGDQTNARQTPTDFVYLNLMAVVPVVSGGDFGLAFSLPLRERGVERGTIITISSDLGLLDHSTK
ncbi:MAG TPA: hypothetical protein VFQ35_08805 [Polyangiaceae bacterium]|nr:hypothetical protein [Polyangiaceae bacterium]